MLLVHPDPPPADLTSTLEASAYRWRAVSDAGQLLRAKPGAEDQFAAAVVAVRDGASARQSALAFCRALRDADEGSVGLLVVTSRAGVAALEPHRELFDDFCVWPPAPAELEARLSRLLARRSPSGSDSRTITFSELVMNLDTYQAAIAGRPLSLTYMEYELLRFMAARPNKVFTREDLLNRVWGYDYYGGARTVDVHIRRLRAKLGEEHAGLIRTVRSVGYCFGRSHGGT